MEIRNMKNENVSITVSNDILNKLVIAGYYDDDNCKNYVLEVDNAKEIILR